MLGQARSEAQDAFEQALLSTNRVLAARLLAEHCRVAEPFEAIENLVVPTLERIGAAWERGEAALAQVYMSGLICEELMDEVLPPSSHLRMDSPRVAIAVVDDYHLLGKRLVYSVLRSAGYDVIDYGRVEPAELPAMVKRDGVAILMLSALMLPSVLKIKGLVLALPEDVKVAVGGAPFRFDDRLYLEVGADAMGATASDALSIIRSFVADGS
jgi:methanogenic corrinoid protein MtbC1